MTDEPVPTCPPVPDIAVTITREPPHSPGVDALLDHSDALSAALYPPEFRYPTDATALSHPEARLLVARRDGVALGCVALLLRDSYGEVKRLIVAPEARGLGIGRALIEAVEAAATLEGLALLRLETGPGNARALDLYRLAAWTPCASFGAYPANPHSMFLEKRLVPAPPTPGPPSAAPTLTPPSASPTFASTSASPPQRPLPQQRPDLPGQAPG